MKCVINYLWLVFDERKNLKFLNQPTASLCLMDNRIFSILSLRCSSSIPQEMQQHSRLYQKQFNKLHLHSILLDCLRNSIEHILAD